MPGLYGSGTYGEGHYGWGDVVTLTDYFIKAQDLVGEELFGRTVLLSSLTATTAVSTTQLAFGGNSEQKFAQKWMWRPDTTTTADKIRFSDSFTPSTGTLTHSGSNYSDTTATDERLIILPEWLEPRAARIAVDLAVQQVREWDETLVPARRTNDGEYWLSDLAWLLDAASIREVRWRRSNILSRNKDFDKWHNVSTAGLMTPPDYWTVDGGSATVERGTTNRYDGPYVAALTRVGTDCTLTQNVGILPTGVSADSLRGRTVTAVLRARCATASVLDAVILENGSVTASSSEHTGGSTYEVLTVSATIAATTDTLSFGARIVTSDVTANLAQCFLADGATVTDADYRDDHWDGHLNDYRFEQGGPLKIHAPNIGFPAQFLVCSERPFPGFDATRLGTGAADADESDAPLVPVAVGTVAILLEQHLGKTHPEAMRWRKQFSDQIQKHLAYPTEGGHGKKMLNPPFAASPMRVR
jgi:hypothetical protein